tara:strand:- start:193 stop:423 length:231 start_codon:yes stop_codon:yes gene_type:complete
MVREMFTLLDEDRPNLWLSRSWRPENGDWVIVVRSSGDLDKVIYRGKRNSTDFWFEDEWGEALMWKCQSFCFKNID